MAIEIKKYANRRLYDTKGSVYITLSDLDKMICAGTDVRISDAKTGEDLTATTLFQILYDRQASGAPLLSADMLAILLRYHNSHDAPDLTSHLARALTDFEAKKTGQEVNQLDQIKQAVAQLNDAVASLDDQS